MKLTEKDKAFLQTLRCLLDERQLHIEFRNARGLYLVLRQNYGEKIEAHFNQTRQGVRWRFQRIFSRIYAEAYQTILWIESSFGTELRDSAMAIARHRHKRALEEREALTKDETRCEAK